MFEVVEQWLGEAPEVRGVVPVMRDVPVIHGGRIIVVAVELWKASLVVRWAQSPPPRREAPNWSWDVTDDVGTEYRLHAGNSGGTDRFWQALSEFRPGPPPGARRLWLWSPVSHPAAAVDVDLPAG
ncbi:MAG: hypothetical protein JOZ99_13855 [Actinobacteria bacterium]|nr:hypothetical protein [Actinomycetota bacterium]